jgi:hypothetical protein
MSIDPLLPPLQDTGTAVEVTVIVEGCVIVALVVLIQPLASVTVTV